MKKIAKLLTLFALALVMVGCAKNEKGNTQEQVYYSFGEQWVTEVDDYDYYDVELKKAVVKIDGKKSESVLYHFTGQWVCYEKIIKEYNDNNKPVTIEIYDYSQEDNDWYGITKYGFYYDNEGELIKETEYFWNKTTKKWETRSGVKIAEIIYSTAKNVLIEASVYYPNVEHYFDYVADEGNNVISITKEGLVQMGEIESISGITGTLKISYNISTGRFSVYAPNLTIDGQRVYWDSSAQKFYN